MLRTLAAVLLFSLSSAAIAAGWTADRVRGEVLVEAGHGWQQVVPGLEVGDGSRLKTGAGARVDFSRGKDHFSLGANTAVQIRDAGPDLMTSVIQTAGTVSVDVERRNVQHFSVQTPFLAAVVKGTKFTVTSNGSGSHVDVDRGVVQVQDSANDLVADVRPGQEAGVTTDAPLQVDGAGAAAVYTSQGVLVSANGNRETASSTVTSDTSGIQPATPHQANQSGNNGRGHGAGNGENSGQGNNGNGGGHNSNGNGGGGGNSGNGNGNGNGGGNNGNGNHGNGNGVGNGNGDKGNSDNGGANNGNGNSDKGNSGNGNSGNGGGNNGNGNGGGNNGNGNDGGNSGNSSEGNSGNGNGNGRGHGGDK